MGKAIYTAEARPPTRGNIDVALTANGETIGG